MAKTKEDLIANGILKAHNFPTYLELRTRYDDGEHMVGLTQATGTGKSYITAQFIYDECFNTIHLVKEFGHVATNPKKVLVLSPTSSLSRQTAGVLYNQLGPNLQHASIIATTYPELLYATEEDLVQQFDVIIVDEFHRLGAEKWGPAVQRLLDANPNAKILGLTATPVRYLDEARDMGEELFNGKVVQGPNIAQAINAGILPKPKYILGLYSYEHIFNDLASAIERRQDTKRKSELEQLLAIAKRETIKMEKLEQIIARNIKEAEESQGGGFVNGKYIAYCSDVNHSKEVIEQLPKLLSSTNQDVHIYTANYKLGKDGNDKQIEAFKNDNSDAIKVMVSINMFDEGCHIPGVKGVFCFANTTSPIKHFQRIGRAIDEGNRDSTSLIFDFVNNLSCLKAFGTTCNGQSSESDPNGYVSPFKDLPFYMDERSLTLAEMLSKLEHLLPDRITAEQWIEHFNEFFKEHPKATSIPQSTSIIGSKMKDIKEAYNNGQGTPSAQDQKIIDWFIKNDHGNMLITSHNKKLSPKEWIEVFTEYFTANPNASSIPLNATFTSAKHGVINIGYKIGALKTAYDNGHGFPSEDVQVVLNWFNQNNRMHMLATKKRTTKILTSEEWCEVFEEYFTVNRKSSSIPWDAVFTSAKHGPQNIGEKMRDLKQAYKNGEGKPSDGMQKIINWLIQNEHKDILKKEDKADISLTAMQWIEVFTEYFTAHPKATSIPDGATFTSAKHGPQNIGGKTNNLKQAYKNGEGKPSDDMQKIINWLDQNEHKDILKKEDKADISLTAMQWIEVFTEYFTAHPKATSIPWNATFTSAKHGVQNIGKKMTGLKQAHNNGQGTPSDGEQTIIKWFISNGREYMLRKNTKIKKDASGGDDDQTM